MYNNFDVLNIDILHNFCSPLSHTSKLLTNGNGFDTAVALHSGLNTNASGFGSPYDIKPGMESYALGQSYDINVMVHVRTWNLSSSTDFDLYGSYGDGWNNDGSFWRDSGGGNYTFDDLDFYNFSIAKLNAGIPIWLAIDQDSAEGGDHWVPMIGVEWFEEGFAEYIYFDTYGLTEERAAVRYIQDTAGGGDQAISFVRTIEYLGPTGGGNETPVPEPSTILLLGLGLIGLAGLSRKRIKNN